MRLFILSAAFVMGVALAPAQASMTAVPKAPPTLHSITVEAQATPQTRAYRRCMRAKYGPRYFAGVRRAHRWHMAQACMA